MKLWYKHKKPSETIFRYDKFYKEIKSFKVVSLSEIEDWKVRLDGDKDKIWKYIKKFMKIRIKNLQESQWNNGKVGKILKQFKNRWYEDRLINVVGNDKVH